MQLSFAKEILWLIDPIDFQQFSWNKTAQNEKALK